MHIYLNNNSQSLALNLNGTLIIDTGAQENIADCSLFTI